MTLKLILDSIEGLPADVAREYVEQDDGTYRLDVEGMEDTFVTIAGNIAKAKLNAEFHVFKSDEKYQSLNGKLGDRYGTELDLGVSYPFSNALLGKVEYARFNEGDVYGTSLQNAARKGDKEIIWLTGIYTF